MTMLITNFDVSKIFIWNNRYNKATYTNSTGSSVTLVKGTLLGRITSSGKVVPHTSAATDGSQNPLGILADDYTVANGASVDVTYCDGGDVAKDKVILGSGDTMTTAVGTLGTIADLIGRNTTIKLVDSTELTGYDNQ